jgi:ribosomal protein S3AE
MVVKKKYHDITLEVLDSVIPILAFDPETLCGKVIKFDLTKILKGKNAEAKFLVKKQDDVLIGEIFSFALYPSFIRKMIGRNISIVEDSFSVKCKDVTLRFKPFFITRKKVHRNVRKALRDSAKYFILKTAQEKERKNIFQAVIAGTLQRVLSKRLKKIYPLAVCEIRVLKVEKAKE